MRNLTWISLLFSVIVSAQPSIGPALSVFLSDDLGGSYQQSVAYDIDNDGDLDVVAIASYSIVWFENLDGSSFSTVKYVADSEDSVLKASPDLVHVADLDGDGLGEIIVSAGVGWYSQTRIFAFPNHGNGRFGIAKLLAVGEDDKMPSEINTHDLDGDGDLDILAVWFDEDEAGWFENMSDGTFSAVHLFSDSVTGARSVKVGDVDGDGDPDVVVGSEHGVDVEWFENLGLGLFAPSEIITPSTDGLRELELVDLDDDFDLDIVTTSDDGIHWLENDGSGAFSSPIWIHGGGWFYSAYPHLEVSDIDGDGLTDIVVGYSGIYRNASWFKQDSTGGFSSNAVHLVGYCPDPLVTDLDGDGDNDILGLTGDGRMLWHVNDGSGMFDDQELTTTNTDLRELVICDLDNDGNLDVVSTSETDSKIGWYANRGGGFFKAQELITNSLDQACGVAVLDDDGDGDYDVIAGGSGLYRIENLSAGNFGPLVELSTIENTCYVEIQDVDGDGFQDIVTAGSGIGWIKGFGAGSYSAWMQLSANDWEAFSPQVVDLDGDGDFDILGCVGWGNQIEWYENLGGYFAAGQTIATGLDLETLEAADLDGDGDVDLIAEKFGDLVWSPNLGDASFGPYEQLASNASADKIEAIDVDYDGDLDILFNSYGVSLIENLGGGMFSSRRKFLEASQGYTFGDIDGDGDQDAVAGNWQGRGDIFWWELNPDCETPRGLTAVSTDSVMQLQWDEVQYASQYRVAIRPLDSARYKSTVTFEPELRVSHVMPGQTYEWTVSANCVRGRSAAAIIDTFSVPTMRIGTLNISVHPNPVSSFLNIQADGVAQLSDMTGRIWWSGNVSGNTSVDVRNYPAGLYTLSASVGSKRFSKQVLVR